MVNRLVRVPNARKDFVGMKFICNYPATLFNGLINMRDYGGLANVDSCFCDYAAASFQNADNRGLALGSAPTLAGSFPADVSLICLNDTLKSLPTIIHALANLMRHAPRALVGHAKLTLQVLCGNAAPSRSHQIGSVKPEGQGSWGFMINRIRRRVNMVPAIVAAIGTAFRDAMVRRDLLAIFASNPIRVQMVFQPFQTNVIVGKLSLKILDRILWELRGLRFHTPTLSQFHLPSRDNYLNLY